MKQQFIIDGLAGAKTLEGEIKVNGAKNAVLPLMSSSVLFSEPVSFENVPDIEDVHRMEELIRALGGTTKNDGKNLVVGGEAVTGSDIDQELAKRMRASMIITGPLLARFGKVSFPHPGGCVLGDRPIDILIDGFQKMGATISEGENRYEVKVSGEKLHAMDFFFRIPSVTNTETFMMAALLAKGTTTLRNAAMEPEIVCLADFLISAGARISGAGTPTITIDGGALLHAPAAFRVIPDRIEAGSFLILGALAGKDITITDCEPNHINALIETLLQTGIKIETTDTTIRVGSVLGESHLKAVAIKTHEYPGFPTDLQAPITVFLTQAAGESLVHETIFDGRLNYTADVVRMGANIMLMDAHRALVKGPCALRGKELDGPDIRAGLAYVIAAIIAEGKSIINNVYYIDRGYEHIEERLQAVGVHIQRVSNG